MTSPIRSLPHLAALQNLLVAGHRPIRMRPGSLVRWGGAFALLAWTTDPLLRMAALQGQPALQAMVAMVWLGCGMGLTGYLDWRANQAAAQQAEETLPFVHVQVSKVWWLLLAAGVLYTGSTFFFGGSYQTYMVWLALVGLGLFLHGLFSQELVEWAGGAIFLLALLVLISGLPLSWHRPLVISTAGLGLPLLGGMLHRQIPAVPHLGRLMAGVAGLLAASVLPAMAFVQWNQLQGLPQDIPVYTQKSLLALGDDPARWPHYVALHVQAGTPIELQLDIQGSVLQAAKDGAHLTYTVAQDLDFLLIDGKLSHHVRRAGQDWQDAAGWLRITQLDMTPDLSQASGLKVNSRAQIELQGMPR
ncbi:MAG: hypothetical protein Q8R67_24080 [Rhodoferax sp.]|nr:hypothetical protein [Rhodoferax sp.]MDP3654749.1 hypothetical protein [Rhodoferax sp.]